MMVLNRRGFLTLTGAVLMVAALPAEPARAAALRWLFEPRLMVSGDGVGDVTVNGRALPIGQVGLYDANRNLMPTLTATHTGLFYIGAVW